MQTLTQGKTLGPGDLGILIHDANGMLMNPTAINYDIYSNVSGVFSPVVLSQTPGNTNIGAYYVPITIPTSWEGEYQLRWNLVQYPVSNVAGAITSGVFIPGEIVIQNVTLASATMVLASTGSMQINGLTPAQILTTNSTDIWVGQSSNAHFTPTSIPVMVSDVVTEDFFVQVVDYASNSFEAPSMIVARKPGMDQKTAQMIMSVRELLSDTNPDRNYHFRPPTPSKIVAGYTSRVGYIWVDMTITLMLKITIAQLNTWNPMALTNYNIRSIPEDWAEAAAVGAAAKCLLGESARWAEEEFGYSLNGVSLDINKSSLYQGLGQTYTQMFETWAPLITANRPASVGLRQQRWLLG